MRSAYYLTEILKILRATLILGTRMNPLDEAIKKLEAFLFIHGKDLKSEVHTEYLNIVETVRKEVNKLRQQKTRQS
jgi:hypothetical protein